MSENKFELIIENGVVTGYKGESTVVEIPEGVTEIDEGTFEFCDFVEEISIKSKALKVIRKNAFRACKNLKICEVETVSAIEEGAFSGCSSLQCFEIPNGAIMIGDSAFTSCDELVYLYVPATVSIIGKIILCSTNINTTVLGEKNTEISAYADRNILNFSVDSLEVRQQLLKIRRSTKTDEVKIINLYGQDIKCYKSITMYYELLSFFRQLESDFFNESDKNIATSLNSRSNLASLLKLAEKYVHIVLDDMHNKGLMFNEQLVEAQLLKATESYRQWCKTYDECFKEFINITKNAKQQVYNNLMSNAESKITGLDYGIIGSRFDLLLHEIDDARARRDQAAVAYGIAKADFERKSRELNHKGDAAYCDFLRKTAKPQLRKAISFVCNSFFEIAFSEFVDAKIISKEISTSYDLSKSMKVLDNALKNENTDKSMAVAFALQSCPINLNAYITAFKYNCVNESILEIIDFTELYNDATFKELFVSSFTYGEIIDIKNNCSKFKNIAFDTFIYVLLEEKANDVAEDILNGYSPEEIDFHSWCNLVADHSETLSEQLKVFEISKNELENAKGQKILSDKFKEKSASYQAECERVNKKQDEILTEIKRIESGQAIVDSPYKKLLVIGLILFFLFFGIYLALMDFFTKNLGYAGSFIAFFVLSLSLPAYSIYKQIKYVKKYRENSEGEIVALKKQARLLKICSFKEFVLENDDYKKHFENEEELQIKGKKNIEFKNANKKFKIVISFVVVVAIILVSTLLINNVIIPRQKFRDIVAVSAGGSHTVGLEKDGTVVATNYTGKYYSNQCEIEDWTDIVAISAGDFYTVGLKSDGTVVAVGENTYGECNVSGWSNIIAISASDMHTVGLKSDGTVVAVGDNEKGQCNVNDWTDIIAIATGYRYTVGLKSDGTVVAVGDNEERQCNVGTWTDIVAISAGFDHTVGLKSNGTVVAVGDDYFHGECNVDDWNDIIAISTGHSHTVGLKSNGTVVAVGNNGALQCNVGAWTDIVAISAGSGYTVGLKSDGTLVAVGNNENGQCNVN